MYSAVINSTTMVFIIKMQICILSLIICYYIIFMNSLFLQKKNYFGLKEQQSENGINDGDFHDEMQDTFIPQSIDNVIMTETNASLFLPIFKRFFGGGSNIR
jgi:hypothetical protein